LSVRKKAEKFEKYLKSGNGRIFAKKHFWMPHWRFEKIRLL
jgi:hypothetical protein